MAAYGMYRASALNKRAGLPPVSPKTNPSAALHTRALQQHAGQYSAKTEASNWNAGIKLRKASDALPKNSPARAAATSKLTQWGSDRQAMGLNSSKYPDRSYR
jgi:hypothetical protein